MRNYAATALFVLSGLFLATGTLRAGAAKGNLLKQAGITRAEAEHIALSQIQDGKIEGAELEKEHGRLIWSFDISRPGTRNITELQVDAKSGKIVSTKIETPKDQAEEAAADKAHIRK
jgi:hypothetical protein